MVSKHVPNKGAIKAMPNRYWHDMQCSGNVQQIIRHASGTQTPRHAHLANIDVNFKDSIVNTVGTHCRGYLSVVLTQHMSPTVQMCTFHSTTKAA